MHSKDEILIEKMLREIQLIQSKIQQISFNSFIADDFVQHGIIMALIIIGELSKDISKDTQMKYNHIPWVKIRGLRNAAAHGYSELRMEDIWYTATVSIPELSKNLQEVLTYLK